MMRSGMGMIDPFLFQVLLKAVDAAPGIKNKATVRKELFHLAILVNGLLDQGNDLFSRGLFNKTETEDKAGKVINQQNKVDSGLVDIKLQNIHLGQFQRTFGLKTIWFGFFLL